MTPNKYRIKIPHAGKELCREIKLDEVLEEIKFSKHCFVVYSPYSGGVELLFSGMNEHVFNDLIVMMCETEPIMKFVKLAVCAAEKIKKQDNKGMSFAQTAVKYIEKHFENAISDKKEG